MHFQFGKAKLHDGARRFRGVAASPVIGCQLVADAGFVGAGGCLANPAAADQLPAGFQDHGELKLAARLLGLLIEEYLHKALHMIRRAIGPVVIPQVARVALISQHRWPIG